MLDTSMPSLLDDQRPGWLGSLIGRVLWLGYRITGKHRYDSFRLERLLDMHFVVMPTVANPKLLRTGAFFASVLESKAIAADKEVLDLGTGSGICALVSARTGRRVVAVDINPAAIRCAAVNASLNRLEHRVDIRHGDLFEPAANERFDLVLFNPPFILGKPEDARDAAWRSCNLAERFAADLADHLKPGGAALLLLSSFGNAGTLFESELRSHGYRLEMFARHRYINETLTILRVGLQSVREKNV